MVIVVRTAVVVGVGVGSHGGREILDSSGRVLKELRLVGIEVDHDGVVIGVAVEVEEEVAGLEVVWFEIEAEKVVARRVFPFEGEPRFPCAFRDAEFDFEFEGEAVLGGNGNGAAGGFGEGERLGRGAEGDGEIGGDEGGGRGVRSRSFDRKRRTPGLTNDRCHEDAGQAHGDRKKDGPEDWISAHESLGRL
jgi:hypothetical protein